MNNYLKFTLLVSGALLTLLALLACGSSSSPSAPAAAAGVSDLAPASQYPGQNVTLTGSNLKTTVQVVFSGSTPGAAPLASGGVQALTFTATDTQVSVTVPTGAGSGPVRVVTSAAGSTTYPTFTVRVPPPAPALASFEPEQARAGEVVTLTGTGFAAATTVLFGGIPSEGVQVVDDTTLKATVPAGARTGLITIGSPGGTGASNGDFKILPPLPSAPTLAPLTTPTGAPGDPLTLTGTGLLGTQSVLFGLVQAAFTVDSDTRLTATVPAAAGSAPITVTTPGGTATTAPQAFTITGPALAVTGFSPASGKEGDRVTITGASLGQATGVTFANVPAAGVTVAPDGASLMATVPPGAPNGTLAVLTAAGPVTVPGGAFTVTSPVLAATGFAPSAGPVGANVVVTGQHLELATGATLGGTAAAAPTVAPDGASLTFQVPPGATNGPVLLTTAGGPVLVPGGAFTVQASGPVITLVAPLQGVPGTEVTLTGSGLGGAIQVRYAAEVLAPARFDVDSDTRIRVRIPDDAQAPGTLTVVTPADQAVTAPFALTPSRRTILAQPLVQVDNPQLAKTWLNFPEARRSAIYGLQEPLAPVFHPYHQEPLFQGGRGKSAPDYTVFLKLPPAYYPLLPQPLRDQVAALGLDPAQVDILVASQDYAFDGVTPNSGVYLFRPHYWTDPEAPVSGIYEANHTLTGALFLTDPGVTVSGHAAGVPFAFGIITHGPGPATAGDILVSANTEPMGGFNVTATTGLWSLVAEGPRAAATLHLLFNDADQATLEALVPGLGTVEDLVDGLAGSSLATGRGVAMLLSLGRPVVDAVSASAPDPGGNRVLTLTGTCLKDATEVTLDGAPLAGFRAVSEAQVKATLPAGAAGALRVTSPFGPSDPVPFR